MREIERLLASVTPGDWHWLENTSGGGGWPPDSDGDGFASADGTIFGDGTTHCFMLRADPPAEDPGFVIDITDGYLKLADGEFIAQAPRLVRELLDALRERDLWAGRLANDVDNFQEGRRAGLALAAALARERAAELAGAGSQCEADQGRAMAAFANSLAHAHGEPLSFDALLLRCRRYEAALRGLAAGDVNVWTDAVQVAREVLEGKP